MAIALWGHEWKRKRIVFHCDNLSTVSIINKGRSKIPVIMSLMRKLTWSAAIGNYTVQAKHILGVNNSIADALSRFQMSRFRKIAPWADQEATPGIPFAELVMN